MWNLTTVGAAAGKKWRRRKAEGRPALSPPLQNLRLASDFHRYQEHSASYLSVTAFAPRLWSWALGGLERSHRAKGGSQDVTLQVSEKSRSSSVGKKGTNSLICISQSLIVGKRSVARKWRNVRAACSYPAFLEGAALLLTPEGTWRHWIIARCKVLGLCSRLVGESTRL